MTSTDTRDVTEVRKGYGPTRKTRKSAQREADNWNASGSGNVYTYSARPATRNWDGTFTQHPARTEMTVAQVAVVEGGFACEYVTTTTTHHEEA